MKSHISLVCYIATLGCIHKLRGQANHVVKTMLNIFLKPSSQLQTYQPTISTNSILAEDKGRASDILEHSKL